MCPTVESHVNPPAARGAGVGRGGPPASGLEVAAGPCHCGEDARQALRIWMAKCLLALHSFCTLVAVGVAACGWAAGVASSRDALLVFLLAALSAQAPLLLHVVKSLFPSHVADERRAGGGDSPSGILIHTEEPRPQAVTLQEVRHDPGN